MTIIPFPRPHRERRGAVHVTGDRSSGFEVAHESSSGDSWGYFSGPYGTGEEAITAAYALNRDALAGECDVFVCEAAVRDQTRAGKPVRTPGEF
jgi:hypothetical protein